MKGSTFRHEKVYLLANTRWLLPLDVPEVSHFIQNLHMDALPLLRSSLVSPLTCGCKLRCDPLLPLLAWCVPDCRCLYCLLTWHMCASPRAEDHATACVCVGAYVCMCM